MTDFLTMSLENRFRFTCPIFDREVEMRGCVVLRKKTYLGKQIEGRRGCQACISASKCPAAEIVRRIAFKTNDATDHCASLEERSGRLPADVLERVAAVLVPDSAYSRFNVSPAERALIDGSRARIEAQIGGASRQKTEPRRTRSEAPEPKTARRSQPSAQTSAITEAARTGDLAAAIST